MFRLKVFKTQIDLFFLRLEGNNPDGRGMNRLSDSACLQATPPHNALLSLVACIFSIDIGYIPAAQHPLLLSPRSKSCHISTDPDLQISPFCSVFANSERLNQIKCLHAHFLGFLCGRSEDKTGCFSCDELCQKHLFCHLQ